MKYLQILVLLTLLGFNSYSQVTVRYSSHVVGLDLKEDKKIPITKNIQKGDGEVTIVEGDSILLSDLFNRITIREKFIVTATDSVSVRSDIITSGGMGITINTPDRIVFKNGQWYSYKNEVGKMQDAFSFTIHGTSDTLNILGYDCIKYVATNETNNKTYFIWATSKLPKTLIPITGLIEFPMAILQVEETSGKFKIEALSIE